MGILSNFIFSCACYCIILITLEFFSAEHQNLELIFRVFWQTLTCITVIFYYSSNIGNISNIKAITLFRGFESIFILMVYFLSIFINSITTEVTIIMKSNTTHTYLHSTKILTPISFYLKLVSINCKIKTHNT